MIDVIILAAGKGTRMRTEKPKALTEILGKPMLEYVIASVESLGIKPYVIVGHKGEDVIGAFADRIIPIWQMEQKGTGHAVMTAKDKLGKSGAKHVVVLSADQPLVRPESIRMLADFRVKANAAFSMATVSPENHDDDRSLFKAMGRIVRDDGGSIRSIVEYKNATEEVRALKEVNITTYCFDPEWLWENIGRIEKNGVSGEFYLTDLVAIATAQGKTVVPVTLPTIEGAAANTPEELLMVERMVRNEIY